jgi:regulator of protease activity HflC (stomatin/prohibitin superfamily)
VVNQQVKVVFGRYTAVKAIQERGALNGAIKDAITETLKYDPMIIIESVQLENIEFSANYLHSIEQRMLAEVEEARHLRPHCRQPHFSATIPAIAVSLTWA